MPGGPEQLSKLSAEELRAKAGEEADLIVLGTITARASGKFGATTVWCTATAAVRVVDLGSGQKLKELGDAVKGKLPGYLIDPASLAVVAGAERNMFNEHGLSVALVPQPDDPSLLFQPDTFAIGGIYFTGNLMLDIDKIDAFGNESSDGVGQDTGKQATEAALSGFGDSGLLALTREKNGDERGLVFDLQPDQNGLIQALPVAEHTDSYRGNAIRACQIPSDIAAEGLFVGVTGKGGRLHVQGWRVGARPQFKVL